MGKIAIDVVLLPSEEMTDKAIEINRELLREHENKIILDKEKCVPHITLCMGCINQEDAPKIEKVLQEISSQLSPMTLIAEDLKPETIPTGKTISCIEISNTEELLSLHKMVMKRLWKFLTYDVEIPMLFQPPEVEEVTLYWIKNYGKKYDNPALFHPHITAGFGETDKFHFPVQFTASKLAIFQLGNYCTCRKLLSLHSLEKENT